MSSNVAATPLSDEELSDLDNFLLEGEEGEERLLIDEAHGYLTALAAGCTDIDEQTLLEAVWGTPEFRDDDEKAHYSTLILRLHQEITASLEAGRPFEPLAIEEEDEESGVYEAYEGWCFGFMLGVADQQTRWDDLPKDERALMEPIATLALLHSDEIEMDEDEYYDWVELISGSVAGLFAYWRERT